MAIIRRGRYNETLRAELRKDKIVQTYSQPWLVELEASDPDPISGAEVLALPGVPRPGRSTYSPREGLYVPFAICKSVSPKPDPKSRRVWHLDAAFELSGSEQQDPEDADLTPVNLTPRIEPFTTDIEIPMLVDYDEQVIVDPFEQLFDSPVMAPIALPGIRVTRYVAAFDELTLSHWKHTTNDAEWRSQPAGTWCITNVTGQEVEIGAFTLGQLTFEISANLLELDVDGVATRVGWMDARALLSNTYLDDADKIQEFRIDGTAPTTRWIDKDGKVSPTVGGRQTPQFLAFRNRQKRDFSLIV